MKLVAVIGPFAAPTPEGIATNIARAKRMRDTVLRLGASPYCAHTMVGDLWHVIPEDVIVPALMEGTRRCDAAVLLEGWERSPGTRREKAMLDALGKPVFRTSFDLAVWLIHEEGTPHAEPDSSTAPHLPAPTRVSPGSPEPGTIPA